MVLAVLDLALSAVGGAALVVVVLLLVGYRLVTDRVAVKSQIDGLTAELEEQREAHDHLEAHVARLETLYNEQRTLKHQAYNDVARALVALEVVRNLAAKCTCDVLSPLGDIITNVLNEMETVRRTRLATIGQESG